LVKFNNAFGEIGGGKNIEKMVTLTREEKETANRYRADLLQYRKLLVSDEMLKTHRPELLEAFKMNESSLQEMKESMIKCISQNLI